MQIRSPLSSIALVGSIILCVGCGDERAPEAQTPAAGATPSTAHQPAAAVPVITSADPTAGFTEVKHIDLRGWSSEAPEFTNPVSLQQGSESQPADLKITFSGGDRDKTALRKALTGVTVSSGSLLVLHITNANAYALPVSIALKTGKTWTYHESERSVLVPNGKGPQQVVIELSKATFKSESTQWKNAGAITELDQIKELQICIYNQKQSGELTVTGVEVRSKP